MTDIVLLSGKQGSGKTTISNALKVRGKQLKYDFVGSMKFADVLYELHEYLLNKMHTYTGKPRLVKDGLLLQLLGTEWGRKTYGDDVWVNILKKKIEKLHDSDNYKRLVVIDDCRFENEFDAFPEALRIRLECGEAERKVRADAWRDKTDHPSETGLDTYAALSRFDKIFYTGNDSDFTVEQTIEHCVAMIFSELQRKSWKESRK